MSNWYIKEGELPFKQEFPEVYKVSDGPLALWRIKEGELPYKVSFRAMKTISDAPSSMWRINEGELPYKSTFSTMYTMGAFKDCTRLSHVKFPSTLQSIGKFSFANTALTEVTLPDNCTYYKTSFPEGCKIKGGKLLNG